MSKLAFMKIEMICLIDRLSLWVWHLPRTGCLWVQHGPQGRAEFPHKVRAGH